jgi:hypothetical protein
MKCGPHRTAALGAFVTLVWHRSDVRASVVAGSLGISQVVLFVLLLQATSDSADSDPFDSPIYWLTWLLVPACALSAGYALPHTPPGVWVAALMLPMAVGVALLGTIWHDPDDGPSLWVAGEVFVGVQAALAWGAASAGSSLRRRT